ncbi:MAG: stage V sporulation protein AC [Firmicutes bacterium]|nr:stage V sporulation protein AC [Bacillota bacterium]
MKQDSKTKQEYQKLVEDVSPNSTLFTDCIKAFIVGGIICCIGQWINGRFKAMGFSQDEVSFYTSAVLIFAASLMTGLGIYSKIGKFAGAGSVVPITGFSNSVTAPAVEFKKEGYILGVGAKIFTIAGPVILYGVATSFIVGAVYYFTK